MATQKGRNWSSGDIVTAANLSLIERGVSEVAEEYTPTTWANGDTVTATALNNIEQGIANAGGGGSSDFSTATLTVNGNFTQSDLFIAPVVEKDPNNEDIAFPQIQSGNSTYTVILYKGRSVLMCMGSQSRTITVSGNIENVYTGVYIITGDCTITINEPDQ